MEVVAEFCDIYETYEALTRLRSMLKREMKGPFRYYRLCEMRTSQKQEIL
jgi:hypothetical protein